jgi:two-component system sensor histidine kinase DegS
VIIKKMDDYIRLTVRDNGKGFRLDQLDLHSKDKGGMGLIGMQERLRLVNGQFLVESEPGKGTTIRATIPLESHNQQPHSTD